MKNFIKAFTATAALTGAVAAPFALDAHNDAQADITVPVPRVTVTLPAATIRLPGPTVRVPIPGPTVRIPGPTILMPVPGPTVTYVSRIPGPTVTVTAHPGIPRPSDGPTATVTVTQAPTGQPQPTRGTVSASPDVRTKTKTETRTKTETIVRNVLVGTLVTLLLAGLGILALFLGYVLGQKDAQRNEDNFMRSLLSQVRGEGKHT